MHTLSFLLTAMQHWACTVSLSRWLPSTLTASRTFARCAAYAPAPLFTTTRSAPPHYTPHAYALRFTPTLPLHTPLCTSPPSRICLGATCLPHPFPALNTPHAPHTAAHARAYRCRALPHYRLTYYYHSPLFIHRLFIGTVASLYAVYRRYRLFSPVRTRNVLVVA